MSSQSDAQNSTQRPNAADDEVADEKLSIEALAEEVRSLRAEVKGLQADKEQLTQTVEVQAEQLDEQATTIDAMEERIAELEQAQEQSSEHRKHLQGRLHTLEEENGESAESPGDDDREEPSTPLGQILQLPKKMIERKLSANQRRALFIAKDVREYAQQVPAGFAIDSSTLRKVLKAKEDQTPHTQTISRVMEFLDRLGKQYVRIVKRRGTKRVVFTETGVERLSRLAKRSGAGDGETASGITGVVIGGS